MKVRSCISPFTGLPERVDADFLHSIRDKQGLLSLKLQKNKAGKWEGVPFVVPGGRFNENAYGWDSYFESLGLIVDGRVDLAKAMA